MPTLPNQFSYGTRGVEFQLSLLHVVEEAEVVGVEVALGGLLEVGGGEGEDVAVHLVEGIDVLEVETGFADALHLVEAGVVGDGHLAYELCLGGMEVLRCERLLTEAAQFGQDELGAALGGSAVNTGIDVEKAGIGEGDVLRLDGVAEAFAFAHGDVEA